MNTYNKTNVNVKDYRRDFGGEVVVADAEYQPGDDLQTPPYALAALDPYVGSFGTAWESAKGEGLLAQAIKGRFFGMHVIETGIEENFFEIDPPCGYDVQITNPPWSKKLSWVKRSLEQRKPFALLLPSRMIFSASAIHLIENCDLEIIQVYPRIGYKSVNMDSFLDSRPQLDSCWLTYGLRIGRRLSYAYIGQEKKAFLCKLKAQEVGQSCLF